MITSTWHIKLTGACAAALVNTAWHAKQVQQRRQCTLGISDQPTPCPPDLPSGRSYMLMPWSPNSGSGLVPTTLPAVSPCTACACGQPSATDRNAADAAPRSRREAQQHVSLRRAFVSALRPLQLAALCWHGTECAWAQRKANAEAIVLRASVPHDQCYSCCSERSCANHSNLNTACLRLRSTLQLCLQHTSGNRVRRVCALLLSCGANAFTRSDLQSTSTRTACCVTIMLLRQHPSGCHPSLHQLN